MLRAYLELCISLPKIFEQLEELCVLKGLTPTQLTVEAINSQGVRWQEFIAEVMTPLKPREPKIRPEDPLYILARVVMVHLIRVFHKRREDPAGFEELRKNAPPEWSFSSIGEQNEADEADWWKSVK
jgi:hypothetical protein